MKNTPKMPNQDTRGKRAIVTLHSGVNIDLRSPDMSEVKISDVAHTLARICRWNGIPEDHFSVAEHCVMAAESAPKDKRLKVLMHDCEESILGDNITPLKNLVPELVVVGNYVRGLLLKHFNIKGYKESDIKPYDRAQTEWERQNIIDTQNYKGMMPKQAKRLFIEKYNEYSKYNIKKS
jgi:hypothetical protein